MRDEALLVVDGCMARGRRSLRYDSDEERFGHSLKLADETAILLFQSLEVVE